MNKMKNNPYLVYAPPSPPSPLPKLDTPVNIQLEARKMFISYITKPFI